MRTPDRSRMCLAYLQSFFKKDWRLRDYPIRYMQQTPSGPNTPERLRILEWRVDIIGWYLAGSGNTKQEAYSDLETRFATAMEERTSLPRPGTSVPIQFATDEQVSRYPKLRDHFVANILGLEWAFISDESSLWDFHSDVDNNAMYRKIEEVYNVDVSQLDGAKLTDIFEEIMKHRRNLLESSRSES